jgi:hypothetical protein
MIDRENIRRVELMHYVHDNLDGLKDRLGLEHVHTSYNHVDQRCEGIYAGDKDKCPLCIVKS